MHQVGVLVNANLIHVRKVCVIPRAVLVEGMKHFWGGIWFTKRSSNFYVYQVGVLVNANLIHVREVCVCDSLGMCLLNASNIF